MDRNFQFIRIYSSIIFWLFIINNNVYGDHYSDLSGCNFQTRQCNWTFSSNWQWQPIVDEHDQHSLQLNSKTFAEQGKFFPMKFIKNLIDFF